MSNVHNRAMRKREKAKAVRLILAELYPKTFTREGDRDTPKVPLMLGIHTDIFQRHSDTLTPAQIRYALWDYTRGPKYLRALLENPNRYDLDGNVAGKVTEEEAKHAKAMLGKVNARRQRRHWAETLVDNPEDIPLLEQLIEMSNNETWRQPRRKLLMCVICGDIRGLSCYRTYCRCGRSQGRFIDGFRAEVVGPAEVFSLDNDSLNRVLHDHLALGDLAEQVESPLGGKEPKPRELLVYLVPKGAKSVIRHQAAPKGDKDATVQADGEAGGPGGGQAGVGEVDGGSQSADRQE